MEPGTSQEPLSLLEKVSFALVLLQSLGTACLTAALAPFRGTNGAHTYTSHVAFAALRTLTANSTIRQMQLSSPDTYQNYEAFMKSLELEPKSIDLEDGAKGYWFGDENAKCLMLYILGGGYVSAASSAHLKMVSDLVHDSKGRESFGCLLLCYSLAPSGVFPRQLIQATSALNYLLITKKLELSQILVAGDSAGGNLGLALLSHLTQPLSSVSVVTASASSKLRGVALLSPWVGFETGASESAKRNADKDCLSLAALKKWSDAFVGTNQPSWYIEPVSASSEWWSRCAEKAEFFFVSAGRDEIFFDDIDTFASKLKEAANPKVTYVAAYQESHDDPVIGYILARPGKCESAMALGEWLQARMSGQGE